MNKVILTGRFTRDPESRMTSNSMEVSRFSLACQNDFVSRDGERSTEFVNCVAFGRTAQTINKYCNKGRLISAIGRIRNGSYDAQDGTKRYTTDIVIENFEFLGGNGGNSTPSNGYSNSNNSYNNYSQNYTQNNNNDNFGYPMDNQNLDAINNIETTDVSEDPYKNFGEEVNISSDDLPF